MNQMKERMNKSKEHLKAWSPMILGKVLDYKGFWNKEEKALFQEGEGHVFANKEELSILIHSSLAFSIENLMYFQ